MTTTKTTKKTKKQKGITRPRPDGRVTSVNENLQCVCVCVWGGGGEQGTLTFPLPIPFNPGPHPIFVGSCLFGPFFDCKILCNVAYFLLFLLLPSCP